MANFYETLFGRSERNDQLPTLNPGQQGLQGNILQQLSGLLGQQGSGSNFAPIETQARQNFAQSTIPSIAERFTALGNGAQRSSAFSGTLGQAGAGLETNLAALRSGNQQQLFGQLLPYGFQQSVENQFRPQTFGYTGEVLKHLIHALLGSAGSLGSTGGGGGGGSQDGADTMQRLLALLGGK